MNNKIIQKVLLAGVITLMFACNTKKEGPETVVADKEQIKKEIQAKEDEFAATYNAGQMKNIGFYADDATSFYQNRAPLVGKPAIVEFLLADLKSNSNKISFITNEVFVSDNGNLVVEIGAYKVVDSTDTPVNTGNYMTLFEKRNGKYVSLRDMSASDRPTQ